MGNSNEFMCLLQVKIHEEHPEYGFDGHKGYGTKAHMEAIHKYLSLIHISEPTRPY